jgi:hypothetical protein
MNKKSAEAVAGMLAGTKCWTAARLLGARDLLGLSNRPRGAELAVAIPGGGGTPGDARRRKDVTSGLGGGRMSPFPAQKWQGATG